MTAQLTWVLSLLAAATLHPHGILAASSWQSQHDNMSEYRLVATKLAVRSVIECMWIAGEYTQPETHGVTFDTVTGNCSMLQCRLGNGGCRKCRNAKNSSMPMLWVRSTGGSSNCWTTLQHRVDASLSFNRNWAAYVEGFGQGEDRNFWMGLANISQFSVNGNCYAGGGCRVRWEFSDWNDTWYWAENEGFSVANASDKYRLRFGALDTARSNVDQIGLSHQNSPNNRQFTTPDSDNDIATGGTNCGNLFQNGWWYGWCTAISANGNYLTPPAAFSGGSTTFHMFYFTAETGGSYPVVYSYSMKSFEILVIA